MDTLLSGLGKRVFLMNNVHEKQPVLFETRWTLSYLRGPMARTEIRRLMEGRAAAPAPVTSASAPAAGKGGSAPVLPPGIEQYYFPIRGTAAQIVYTPVVVAAAQVHFADPKSGVDEMRDLLFAAPLTDDVVGLDWVNAKEAECAVTDLERVPEDGATFASLPPAASKPKNYEAWQKSFATWLFRTQAVDLLRSPSLQELSHAGENERDFRIRLQHSAREERDRQKAALQDKYTPKLQALEERKRKAEQRRDVEKEQSNSQILNTAVTLGAGLLGAFLGRKALSVSTMTRASQTVRSASRAMKERSDVGRASENVEAIEQELQDLNTQFEAEVAALSGKIDPATETFETVSVHPKKSDIAVRLIGLGWRA